MKNNPVIRMKPAAEEQKVNDQLTFDFILAVMTKDLTALDKILKGNGSFLNGKSRWETLNWFRNQFEQPIPDDFFECEVMEYVCNSYYFGSRSLMFFKGYFPVVKNKNRVPKTLTLAFEGEKIADIKICYNFLSIEKIKEYMDKN
jgi:hypothetical protein